MPKKNKPTPAQQQYLMLGQLAKRVDELERRQLNDEQQFGAHVTFMLGTEKRVEALAGDNRIIAKATANLCNAAMRPSCLVRFYRAVRDWCKRVCAEGNPKFCGGDPAMTYNARNPMTKGDTQ